MKEIMNVIQHHPVVAEENMSNLTSASGEASVSSNQQSFASPNPNPNPVKKKRNLPGNPDPDAEVIALSPKTLLATNRFVCEICNKGFQRDQNLQLHRRGHNLPWKLKQRSSNEVIRKKVYVCPEATCVHHDPSRALGDLTGVKKHFCRKHGEKKWKCDKCSKKYAVQSDWKAHAKTCGTREYRCDCGTLFSRRDSFITHRAFCDALAEESARVITGANTLANHHPLLFSQSAGSHDPSPPHATLQTQFPYPSITTNSHGLQDFSLKKEQQQQEQQHISVRSEVPDWLACQAEATGATAAPAFLNHLDLPPSLFPEENPSPASLPPPPYRTFPHMSATELLQRAAQMGSTMSGQTNHGQMAGAHTASTGGASSAAGFGLGLSSTSHQELRCFAHGSAPPPALVQDVIMMNSFSLASGHDVSFEDASRWMMQGSSREVNSSNYGENIATRNEGSGRGAAADGLTRDFLGLRALSPEDILSIAGLEPCMSSSSSYENPHQTKKPWIG